jgi:hypothetical protein
MNNDSVPAGQRGFLFFDLIGPTIPNAPVLAWDCDYKEQLLVGRGSAGGDLLFKLLLVIGVPPWTKGSQHLPNALCSVAAKPCSTRTPTSSLTRTLCDRTD